MFRLAATKVMLSLIFIPAAMAQSSNPAWIEDLIYELARLHECEVALLLDMQEDQIGGRNTYFAKVQCKDGRQFDASRIEPKEQFDIRLCEVISC